MDRCRHCGEQITYRDSVWLTLDEATNTYGELGEVPAERAKGSYTFGKVCAERAVTEHRRALAHTFRRIMTVQAKTV